MAEQARRNQTLRRDRQPPERPTDEARNVHGLDQAPAKLRILQRAAMAVERREVGLELGALAVAGREARIVAESFHVRRQDVERDGETPRLEILADFLRRSAEPEHD